LGVGGLGVGVWGLGFGAWAPPPNPQSPIPKISKINILFHEN